MSSKLYCDICGKEMTVFDKFFDIENVRFLNTTTKILSKVEFKVMGAMDADVCRDCIKEIISKTK